MSQTYIKPLFIGTQDYGGAAIAALRLLDALQEQAIDATYLTYYKTTKHPTVTSILSKTSGLEKLWLRAGMTYARHKRDAYYESHNNDMWSSNQIQQPIHEIINRTDANLLHFHWIGSGFIPLASMPKFNKPIVWTLHDMWAFTGGCHYARDCTRYESHCANCPLLDNSSPHDTSYHIFADKLKYWQDVPMTIIAPSNWLADCARRSPLLKDKTIEVIPNLIDTEKFKPLDKQFARQALDLPENKSLLLFGASNIHTTEKGFPDLQTALSKSECKDIELLIFGTGQVDTTRFPVPVHSVGHIADQRLLRLLYNAADALVLPSHMDNLPNTVMEALACGTPTVAYRIGGLPDMIDHQQNGYLAEPLNTQDLANGINWILSEADAIQLSHHARQKVLDTFKPDVVATQYINIYERVLETAQS